MPTSRKMGRAGDGGLRTILERTGTGNGEKAADTPGVGNAGLDVVRILAPLAEAGTPPVVAQVDEAGIVDLQMDASGIRPRRDLPPIGRDEVIRRMPGGVPFPAGHFAKAVRLEGKVPLTRVASRVIS